jgi:hypothetical protein
LFFSFNQKEELRRIEKKKRIKKKKKEKKRSRKNQKSMKPIVCCQEKKREKFLSLLSPVLTLDKKNESARLFVSSGTIPPAFTIPTCSSSSGVDGFDSPAIFTSSSVDGKQVTIVSNSIIGINVSPGGIANIIISPAIFSLNDSGCATTAYLVFMTNNNNVTILGTAAGVESVFTFPQISVTTNISGTIQLFFCHDTTTSSCSLNPPVIGSPITVNNLLLVNVEFVSATSRAVVRTSKICQKETKQTKCKESKNKSSLAMDLLRFYGNDFYSAFPSRNVGIDSFDKGCCNQKCCSNKYRLKYCDTELPIVSVAQVPLNGIDILVPVDPECNGFNACDNGGNLPSNLVTMTVVNYGTGGNYLTVSIGLDGGPIFGGQSFSAWCTDVYHPINVGQTYTAELFCSLNSSWFAIARNLGVVLQQQNICMLNYILNQRIRYETVLGYTFGDVQTAIWRTIIGTGITDPSANPYTEGNVDLILADALANGQSYVPTLPSDVFGIFVAPVVTLPGGGNHIFAQLLIISVTVAMFPVPCASGNAENLLVPQLLLPFQQPPIVRGAGLPQVSPLIGGSAVPLGGPRPP